MAAGVGYKVKMEASICGQFSKIGFISLECQFDDGVSREVRKQGREECDTGAQRIIALAERYFGSSAEIARHNSNGLSIKVGSDQPDEDMRALETVINSIGTKPTDYDLSFLSSVIFAKS